MVYGEIKAKVGGLKSFAVPSSYREVHRAEILRPDYGRGSSVEPAQIEFWVDGARRLHDRFLFTKEEIGWRKACLYP